jgi:hypothetical protein
LLTVSTNLLGVFTIPVLLPLLLGASAGGARLEPAPLFKNLVLTVLLPLLSGMVLQSVVPGALASGLDGVAAHGSRPMRRPAGSARARGLQREAPIPEPSALDTPPPQACENGAPATAACCRTCRPASCAWCPGWRSARHPARSYRSPPARWERPRWARWACTWSTWQATPPPPRC